MSGKEGQGCIISLLNYKIIYMMLTVLCTNSLMIYLFIFKKMAFIRLHVHSLPFFKKKWYKMVQNNSTGTVVPAS